jgi:AcrR family transcriptional regulator
MRSKIRHASFISGGSVLGTLRERWHQLRATAILDAMRDLMAARGYAATSMDELAAHLGISKAMRPG